MNITKTKSCAFSGVDAIEIDIEVAISDGFSSFIIVGLADKAISESKERIYTAINNLGLSIFGKKIIVNLSPSNIIKEGTHFDLAIALAIIANLGIIPKNKLNKYFILGELSLDGQIKDVRGVLPATIKAIQDSYNLICPVANLTEAMLIKSKIEILAANNLTEIINHFNDKQFIDISQKDFSGINNDIKNENLNMTDIYGQYDAKRAMEIAASGGHNILMICPAGVGKSMIAKRITTILPELTDEEIYEVNMIHSIAGTLKSNYLIRNKVFRHPHHTASPIAITGGGNKARPGEISLAHHGILFLDELPEFPKTTLETLREPLENKEITISRANYNITYPANFQLIAAMNPCKCGFYPDPEKSCNKAPICAQNYMSKISNPIMDRIDIIIYLEKVDLFQLDQDKLENSKIHNQYSSENIKKKVIKARDIQRKRFKKDEIKNNFTNNSFLNAVINDKKIEKYLELDNKAKEILENAIIKFGIYMRGYKKILKVARTIADLDNSKNIEYNHILEAVNYRKPLFTK